jgi:ATP-dependent Clp protease protease subunit
MNYMKCGVSTICVGTAASMASFVLAGGDKGNRIALPHARIMIHQPEGGSKGQASEVLSESEEVLRIRRQVGRIYAEKTGQPLSRISRDLDRDQFLSAKEAKEYGLIDKIAVAS